MEEGGGAGGVGFEGVNGAGMDADGGVEEAGWGRGMSGWYVEM